MRHCEIESKRFASTIISNYSVMNCSYPTHGKKNMRCLIDCVSLLISCNTIPNTPYTMHMTDLIINYSPTSDYGLCHLL